MHKVTTPARTPNTCPPIIGIISPNFSINKETILDPFCPDKSLRLYI